MFAIANFLLVIINIYIYLLIASAILSWLVTFEVVNTRNRVIYVIGDFLYRITEPPLRPIRRLLPNFGGIDISPVVLILVLQFLLIPLINWVVLSLYA